MCSVAPIPLNMVQVYHTKTTHFVRFLFVFVIFHKRFFFLVKCPLRFCLVKLRMPTEIWVFIMIHSGWGRDNSIVTFKHEMTSSIVTSHNPIIYKEIVNPIMTGLFLPQYSGYLLNKTCFQIKKKSWTLNKMFSQNLPPLLHVYWKSAFWSKIILCISF